MQTFHDNHSFRFHQSLRAFCLLGFAASSLLITSIAVACSCRFEEQQGFIHGGGRLPSNARGVLFKNKRLDGMLSYENDFIVVDKMPPPFDASAFVIREVGKDTPLPAVIEKVRLSNLDSSDNNSKGKVYFTDNTQLQTCIRTRDRGTCQAAKVDLEKAEWRQELISSGRLQDVTERAAPSGELFRIRPSSGFVQGTTYLIQRNSVQKVAPLNVNGVSYDREDRGAPEITPEIKIEIDPPLLTSNSDQFSIGLLGKAKRESISVAAGGSCSQSFFGTSQMLRYDLPQQYEAYREIMMYFTETKTSNLNRQDNTFHRWIYRPSLCDSVSLGGSNVGVSQEKVFRSCGRSGQDSLDSAPLLVRGRLGFLEMGDDLFQTPERTVHFDDATLGSCDVVGGLIEAMNAGESEAETKTLLNRTCGIGQNLFQIADNQVRPILQLLVSLTQSDHGAIRQCAIGNGIAFYKRLGGMQVRPEDDPQLSKQVNKLLGVRKTSADFQYASLMLKAIDTSMFADAPALQTNARYYFKELVGNLWSRQPSLQLAPKENEKLVEQSLAMLRKMLQTEKRSGHHIDAIQVIRSLGSKARPLTSELLSLLDAPLLSTYGLESVLALVAPDDPRVFDAVVKQLKKPYRGDAAEALVALGKDKKPLVLDILISTLDGDESSNWSVIRAIGSMGYHAMVAKPTLYQLVRTSKLPNIRQVAILALVSIDNQDPEIAQVIQYEIERPVLKIEANDYGSTMRRHNYISELSKLGKNAQRVLPTLKNVMKTKLNTSERYALETVFRSMQLEDKELQILLTELMNTRLSD